MWNMDPLHFFVLLPRYVLSFNALFATEFKDEIEESHFGQDKPNPNDNKDQLDQKIHIRSGA
jgi:hypothetical protein